MNKKVCHISSVHYRYENRILLKECLSLSRAGYDVFYIVADGKGDEVYNGVKIIDVGNSQSRLHRILSTSKKLKNKTLELECKIVHFHDPELIFPGLKLMRKNLKVIYDIHEDVPLQIFHKHYLPGPSKKIISNIVKYVEDRAKKKFSYNIAANPVTYDKTKPITNNLEIIYNYPLLVPEIKDWEEREDSAVYLGKLMQVRGLIEMLDAALLTDVKIHIIGEFESQELEQKALSHPGWGKIIYHGQLPWVEAAKIVQQAKYGLAPIYLTEFYREAMYPSKLFEYMMLGLVVIITQQEQWKQIIDRHHTGLTINEVTGENIAQALNYLAQNPAIAQKMSQAGRQAALQYYNWGIEEKKLLNIYNQLAKN